VRKAKKATVHRQVDWSIRLLRLNDEVSRLDSNDRVVSVRDYLHVATKELIRLGEAEHDNAFLLVARVCQGLENTMSTLLGPRLTVDYERHGLEPIPPPSPQEAKLLLASLRSAANMVGKISKSNVRGIAVPETKERSAAAIQCRDNIANTRNTDAEIAANDLLMACHLGFGARFLWNVERRSSKERWRTWLTECQRIFDRADLSTRKGRLEAATRIVLNCAQTEGMTAPQAKDLFKNDPEKVRLQGSHQVKKGPSRH
jgi:hypothetical protein